MRNDFPSGHINHRVLVERWVGMRFVIARVERQKSMRTQRVGMGGRIGQEQISFSQKLRFDARDVGQDWGYIMGINHNWWVFNQSFSSGWSFSQRWWSLFYHRLNEHQKLA